MQYWAHTITMLDFYETWANWRRTGFPKLTPVNYPGNATSGTIPRRFPYPSTEEAINGENFKAAAAAVPGGDNLAGRVWWDK
ncbi:SusD/RagB family nutrient-binding outer membrane lipoprotein [Sphingobacterium sp. E70]|nr:SusD/RagB family nutrient-binding outer membrane lipoprotein [Sphingobacterium sp. E70]